MVVGIALAAVGAVILGAPAMVAGIVAAVVAVVATLVVVVKEHWAAICGFFAGVGQWFQENVIQPVAGFFTGLWASSVQTASSCWEGIKSFFAPAIAWFSELFSGIWQTVSTVFYNIGVIISGCWAIVQAAWAVALEFFSGLWESISQWATNAWGSICEVFSGAWEWLSEKVIQPLKEAFQGLWEDISGWASDAWDGICKLFGNASDFFKGLLNGLIGLLNSAISWVFGGINKIISGLRGIQLFDISPFAGLKDIPVPKIPLLAQGAVLPANKPFLAMVGDQRHGTNVEAPLSTIQEAVALVMDDHIAAMMAGFEAVVQAIREQDGSVVIGDEVIARATERYQRKMAVVMGGMA